MKKKHPFFLKKKSKKLSLQFRWWAHFLTFFFNLSFLDPPEKASPMDDADLDLDGLDDDDEKRALRRFHGPRSGDDAKSVRVLLFGEALVSCFGSGGSDWWWC